MGEVFPRKDLAEHSSEALAASERRFSQLIQNSFDTIVILDADGIQRYVSPSAERVHGYAPAELLDIPVIERMIHPEDQARVQAAFRQIIETGAGGTEYRHRRKAGGWVYLEGYGTNQLANPDIRGVVVNVRDITERKAAEEAFAKGQARLQAIVETSQDWIWEINAEGIHTFSNPAVQKILGWAEADLIGKTNFSLLHADDRALVEAMLPRWIADRSGWNSLILRWRHKDGSYRYLESNAVPIIDETGHLAGFRGVDRDITERKKAEDELTESQQRLALATRSAGIGIWDWDVVNNRLIWDEQMYRIYGIPEKAAGTGVERWDSGLHPDDKAQALEASRVALRGERDYNTEFRILRPDGTIRHIKADGMVIRDEHGKAVRVLGVNTDITGWKQAELALRASEAHLQSLMQNASGFFFYRLAYAPSVPGGAKVLLVSPSIREVAGISDPYDFAAWFTCIHPEDRPRVIAANQRSLETGEPYDEVTRWHHQLRDEWIWVRTMSRPVYDASGKPTHFNGLCIDVTEQKKAEQALERERSLYKDLVDSQPSGVYRLRIKAQKPWGEAEWVDKVGSNYALELVSDKFCEILGATREQCAANASIVVESIHPEDRESFVAGNVHALETLETFKWEGRLKVGEKVTWVQFASVPRRLDDGDVIWTGILLDITALRKLEENLRQAVKMDAVGRLAGGVAHDFNNMLGAILGYTELAMEGCREVDPLYANLKHIEQATVRSVDLTRQLLAFARKQTVAPKVLDLNVTVEGMLKLLRRLIGEDIELVWKPCREPAMVKMDPTQLDQILANLCVNARDAIASGGVITIETSTTTFDESLSAHTYIAPGEYVLLAVSDNGCGMDAQTVSHIFEPFFTTKEQGKGTGLGLATVYGVVKQNSGYINVYSEPGQGTTFKIYLPRQAPQGASDAGETTAVQAAASGKEVVLLVEDEPMMMEISMVMLRKLGYQVLAAGRPAEAIELVKQHTGRIDLLMTDVVMPGMNGRELGDRLLALRPDLKRLYMSGYTADVIAHHGVLDEGVRFIQKPFSMKVLGEKVREVLGK